MLKRGNTKFNLNDETNRNEASGWTKKANNSNVLEAIASLHSELMLVKSEK